MKNRNLLIYVLTSILITIIFSGCKNTLNTNLLLISSPDNKTINYYKYNIQQKKLEKIYSTNKTCYPTATLSINQNILYLTKSDENGFPQLFEVDLNNKKEQQLTSKGNNKIINVDFLKINYSKNLIYLRVVQENHRNFNFAIYDIKANSLNILEQDEEDLSNQFFDFNNISNSILILQNSIQEEFDLMKESNKSKNFNAAPNYNIIMKDENGNNKNTYGTINNNVIDVSISPTENKSLVLTGDIIDLDNHKFKKTILLKNLNDNNTEELLNNLEDYKDISKICFYKDGNGFYFIASKRQDEYTKYNLYYYDINNKTSNSTLSIDNENILDCIPIY